MVTDRSKETGEAMATGVEGKEGEDSRRGCQKVTKPW